MNINVLPHHPNKQQIMYVLSEEVIIAVIRQKEKGDNPEYDSMKNTKKLMSQSSKHAWEVIKYFGFNKKLSILASYYLSLCLKKKSLSLITF